MEDIDEESEEAGDLSLISVLNEKKLSENRNAKNQRKKNSNDHDHEQ